MSKSLEALDNLIIKTGIINDTCASLKDCIKCGKCKFEEPVETCDDYNLIMTIKQDLERIQQLEIADRNNQNLVKTNVDLVNKNLDLQKENQELLIALENKNNEIKFLKTVINDNKLKKAIEILKNKMLITVNIPYVWFEDKDNCLYFKVNQQEYELLKEVLEDE